MEDSTLEAWDQAEQPQQTMTLEQMDSLVVQLRELKTKADEAKAVFEEMSKQYEDHRALVLNALLTNKRDKYEVEGAGMVYISRKETYRVPKSNEDKTKLFNYIKEKYGPDAHMSMVGIHSGTLNTLANKESEERVMQIPGLEAPTMLEQLNFRR